MAAHRLEKPEGEPAGGRRGLIRYVRLWHFCPSKDLTDKAKPSLPAAVRGVKITIIDKRASVFAQMRQQKELIFWWFFIWPLVPLHFGLAHGSLLCVPDNPKNWLHLKWLTAIVFNGVDRRRHDVFLIEI